MCHFLDFIVITLEVGACIGAVLMAIYAKCDT